MHETMPVIKKIRSYCCQCSSLCPIVVSLQDETVIKIESDKDHPNSSPLCPKGLAGAELLYDPQRLQYPMKRTNPKSSSDAGWQRITWDEAFKIIAANLIYIKAKYGPESVVFNRPGPGGSPSTDYAEWVVRLASAFGSPNALATGHTCMWHRDTGSTYTFGKGGVGVPQFEKAAGIVIWGHNPNASSRSRLEAIRRGLARGAKLIVIDPREIELATKADVWLQVRPGTDGALALSLINVLIEKGTYDRDFTRDWTNAPFLVRQDNQEFLTPRDLNKEVEGFVVWDNKKSNLEIYDQAKLAYEALDVAPALEGNFKVTLSNKKQVEVRPVFQLLNELVKNYSPDQAQIITGVPAEKIVQAADLLGSVKPFSYWTYNGLEQHTNATQTSRAIGILYSITGNYDSQGANVIYAKIPSNPVRGSHFLSPEVQKKRLAAAERPLGPAANQGSVQANIVAKTILTGKPYPVKALVAIGGNFITANSNSIVSRDALRKLEFYVHSDLYLTPSAELADIVLPAATYLESRFVRVGFSGLLPAYYHIQLRPSIVKPLYESRPDLELIFDLAKHLGFGDRFWNGDTTAAFNYHLAPTGLTVDILEKNPGGVTLAIPVEYQKYRTQDVATGQFQGFATQSKKIEIYNQDFLHHGYDPLPVYLEPALSPASTPEIAKKFPLVLTCNKLLQFCQGQHHSIPSLRKVHPYPLLEINPQTARQFKVKNEEWIHLETPAGKIKLKAKVTDKIAPDVVCTQVGWWQSCQALNLAGFDPYSSEGANLNSVLPVDLLDPISGSLPYKAYLCNIKKIRATRSGSSTKRVKANH